LKELKGKQVLVTGAASGIGRETSLAFAREGASLLLADKDAGGLEDAARLIRGLGAQCSTYIADVSNIRQINDMARIIEGQFGGLDVLVNNAGVFIWADFMDTTLEDWRWIMGTNLWGPIYMIGAFLPSMIERGSGHIVNIASGGGLVTLPALTAYCTTKFGLVGLGEALQHEVRDKNITVTTVCPGSTKTQIIEHIRVRGLDREKLEKVVYPKTNRYPADKTASIIVKAVKRDRHLVVTTTGMKLMVYIKRLSPALYRALIRPFAKFFYTRMRG
jgi:NAD(P)-dependent dehydrogenase (short-subunit alcohol dehydrogenase family)